MRWGVLAVLAGCAGEPEPGEVGYVDCDPIGDIQHNQSCAPVDFCCELTGPTDVECRYETQGGEGPVFFCESEWDCGDAAESLAEATCE